LLRRKFVISLLLILTIALFAYVRREVLFQQAKNLIKQNLEKSLLCELSVGTIKTGLLYGLLLENLEISFPQGHFGLALEIKVDQAFVDYNLWQHVFTGRKYKDFHTLRLISPTINLSYAPVSERGERLPSTINLLRNLVFTLEDGQFSLGNNLPLIKNLQGRILLSQNGLIFEDIKASLKENSQNALNIYGELSEDRLCLTANLEHLKIEDFDVLSNLSLTLNKGFNVQDGTEKVSGTLKTYGSVINKRPFPELSSAFEIRDGRLRILGFSLGDNYNLRGIVNLSAPFDADLSLNFYQAVPSELIAQFSFPEQPDFSGLFNGLIKITGQLTQPKVEGYLEVNQGRIGDVSFVSADINIKGRYPKISIVDSRICREDDSFLVEAEMDFSELGQQDFLSLRFKPDKSILWQGWDITRRRENQVHISKNIADGVKVTFDTFMQDASEDYQDNYINELGLEYRIFGDKLLKLRLRKEEEILGLERRIKF
jgi:hypothetical protein